MLLRGTRRSRVVGKEKFKAQTSQACRASAEECVGGRLWRGAGVASSQGRRSFRICNNNCMCALQKQAATLHLSVDGAPCLLEEGHHGSVLALALPRSLGFGAWT